MLFESQTLKNEFRNFKINNYSLFTTMYRKTFLTLKEKEKESQKLLLNLKTRIKM